MDVAVTGSTGLIGSALVEALGAAGHRVLRLVRPGSQGASGETATWDPPMGTIDAEALEGLGGVVHLAGRAIAPQLWTAAYKKDLLESRTVSTTLLATTLAGLQRPPPVLVSGSAQGWYGSRGDELLTESAASGRGYLADVCRQWEAAAGPAAEAGIRVAWIRTGLVLSASGGALGRMLHFFKLGLGGRIGPGTQWWSWISLADQVGAIVHLLGLEGAGGPYNMGSPNPVTNKDFTAALGKILGRPAVLAVPTFVLRAAGEFADEMLLASQRMAPERLLASGYTFAEPDLVPTLERLLKR